MDTITEIKEGVQGMNLDPVTALLFEQSWLLRQLESGKTLLRCTWQEGIMQVLLETKGRQEDRLLIINQQIEELGNKTFTL